MNELIRVNINEEQQQVVSGRELHGFLKIETPYSKWFQRMKEYGFTENVDFCVMDIFVQDDTAFGGHRKIIDHAITIDMAKELCMIQRTEKGKQARQYFIQIEKQWNSPEMVMKRAMDYLNARVEKLQTENLVLIQQNSELQPKASYYDMVLQNKSLLSVSKIAKDYGMSAIKFNKLLNDLGVQFKQGDIWLLYAKYQDKGYTQTTTHVIDADNSKVTTKWTQKGRLFLYELLKSNGILPIIEKDIKGAI